MAFQCWEGVGGKPTGQHQSTQSGRLSDREGETDDGAEGVADEHVIREALDLRGEEVGVAIDVVDRLREAHRAHWIGP